MKKLIAVVIAGLVACNLFAAGGVVPNGKGTNYTYGVLEGQWNVFQHFILDEVDAGGATNVQWNAVEGTPTDLAGYGITDAYTKVESDGKYATGTPIYVESDPVWTGASTGYYTKVESDGMYATGTPIYVETDPVWTGASTGYYTKVEADGAFLPLTQTNLSQFNNDVPFATGTPIYVETDPVWTGASTGYYTKVESDGKYSTGTPLYVESDPNWAQQSNLVVYATDPRMTNDRFPLAHYQDWTTITGTPTDLAGYGITDAYTKVESDGKYATGTPIYVESDPVWVAASTGYPTWVEADGKYATGTPIYVETDPVWVAASTGYYTKVESDGLYATGTPVYVETDPVWESEKANYATGTPVYVEADPVWSGVSNEYLHIPDPGYVLTGILVVSNEVHMKVAAYIPSAVQTVAASGEITVGSSFIKVIGNAAGDNDGCTIASSAVPGQMLVIMGMSDANRVQITTVTPAFTLGNNDVLGLIWRGADPYSGGEWVELYRKDN